MSWEASTYVLGSTVGSATRKLVLMGFANHAHKDGTAAFCGVKTVADYAECDVRTAQRHIKALVSDGWMREGDQQLVSHYPKNQRPIVYDLAMNEATRIEWQAVAASGGNARRERAAAAGTKGGVASAQVRAGDRMSPPQVASNGAAEGGDRMSPAEGGDTGVTGVVTPVTAGGDTGVTQTIQEPTLNRPSSLVAEDLPASSPIAADAAETNEPPKPETARGTRLPEPFEPTQAMRDWVVENAPHIHAWRQHQQFCDYWRGIPGARGRKTDWEATWRNWMRKAEDDAAPAPARGGAPKRGDIDWDAAAARAEQRDAFGGGMGQIGGGV